MYESMSTVVSDRALADAIEAAKGDAYCGDTVRLKLTIDDRGDLTIEHVGPRPVTISRLED